MLTLFRIVLLMLLGTASCDDTVADDIGSHMMNRLSEFLSPEECQSFYTKISGQVENEVLKLEQLSEGNNPIHSHKQSAISNPEQCQKTLSHWLDSKGDSMYWDHLAEALQAIGRSDVSLEHLGKNLSHDKNLESEKDVEEHKKTVQRKTSLPVENKTTEQEQLRQDKETTKILSDSENLEQLILPKTESSPPYKIHVFTWIDLLLDSLFWDIPKSFILNILALCLFYTYMGRLSA